MKTYKAASSEFILHLIFIIFIIAVIWGKIQSVRVKVVLIFGFLTLYAWTWIRKKIVSRIHIDDEKKQIIIEESIFYLFSKKLVSIPAAEVRTHYYETLATMAIKVRVFVLEAEQRKFEINPYQEGWSYKNLDNIMADIDELKTRL